MPYLTLHTNGKGLWSDEKKAVEITSIQFNYIDVDDFEFGELIASFSAKSWNVEKHGLIYTDKQFIKELRSFLKSQGIHGQINYSEQGMQGNDYVSLDVCQNFIKSWSKYFNIDQNDNRRLERLLGSKHNSRTMRK